MAWRLKGKRVSFVTTDHSNGSWYILLLILGRNMSLLMLLSVFLLMIIYLMMKGPMVFVILWLWCVSKMLLELTNMIPSFKQLHVLLYVKWILDILLTKESRSSILSGNKNKLISLRNKKMLNMYSILKNLTSKIS